MDNIFLKLIKIIPEAVLVINANAEINACNGVFEEFSGFRLKRLLGQSPCIFLDTNSSLQLEQWFEGIGSQVKLEPKMLKFKSNQDNYFQYLIHPKLFELDEELLLILIIDQKPEGQNTIQSPAAQSLIDSFNLQRIKLHTLEEELNEDSTIWNKTHPDLIYLLQDIDSTLAQLNESLMPRDENIDMRCSIVEVMKLTTNYWKETTHTKKADLARHSGLWKVYTNEDGWDRTQTMDRYLNLTTLPKYPRRKQVCRTAEFVLSHLSAQNKYRHTLEHSLAKLRQLR